MTRYLIVNADDFGLTEGVSRGIIRAHREGILTSTTFMVNFPWAAQMAPLLQEAPNLGVGIHLNLTTGRPLLPPEQIPSAVRRDGTFSKSLLHLVSRVDSRHVLTEWSAQVERGIDLLGRIPTHLDTHRYLQGIPRFAEVVIQVAQRYRIGAVRVLYPGPDLHMQDLYAPWSPTRLVVSRLLARSAGLMAQSGLGRPDGTIAGDFDQPSLLERLARLRQGVTELICHPGLVDPQLRSISSLREQREAELAALTAPAVKAQIQAMDVKLVDFSHLAVS